MKTEALPITWEEKPDERIAIIVVDDDVAMGELAGFLAEVRCRARVLVCDTPDRALEVFVADPGRWGLVLTDFHMPGMTGKELASRLRAVRPELPIVMMSAEACAANACGLTQPFKFLPKAAMATDLENAIQQVTSYHSHIAIAA